MGIDAMPVGCSINTVWKTSEAPQEVVSYLLRRTCSHAKRNAENGHESGRIYASKCYVVSGISECFKAYDE